MKKIIVNAIACVCALAVFAGTDATVNVTATLKDGSSVRGDFLTKNITGATLFAKKLVLTPSIVKTVNFTSTNGEAKVELSNGDRFAIPSQTTLSRCVRCSATSRFLARVSARSPLRPALPQPRAVLPADSSITVPSTRGKRCQSPRLDRVDFSWPAIL